MHGSVSDLDAKTMCWIACLATVDTFMRMDCPLWNKVDPNTNCLSVRFQGDRQLHASKEHPIFSMSSATFQLSEITGEAQGLKNNEGSSSRDRRKPFQAPACCAPALPTSLRVHTQADSVDVQPCSGTLRLGSG